MIDDGRVWMVGSRIVRVVALTAAVIAAGVAANAQDFRCDRFHVDHAMAEGRLTLTFAGGVPDGAEVNIEVSRRIWWDGQTSPFSIEYLFKTMPAAELTKAVVVDVTEKRWQELLAAATSRRKAAGRSTKATRVDRRIKVKFETPSSETNREFFGEHNSGLHGKAVVDEGHLKVARWLRFLDLETTDAESSGVAPPPERAATVEPKVGGWFLLGRSALLVCHPHPVGDLVPSPLIKSITARSLIHIDRRSGESGETAFRIATFDAKGGLAGMGWLEARALEGLTAADGHPQRAVADGAIPAAWRTPAEVPSWTAVGAPKAHEKWPEPRSVTMTIVVPEGLTRETLMPVVRAAAWEAVERTRCDDVVVRARRASKAESDEAVAAIYKMSRAPIESGSAVAAPWLPGAEELVVEAEYLERTESGAEIGARIEFVMKENTAWLSKVASSTAEADRSGRVVAGSRGRLLAVRAVDRDGTSVRRFEVEADSGANGWIDADLVKILK